MLRLQCDVKQYKWGQPGSTSLVADLASHGEGQVPVDEQEPYAELWMGSHVSGPSVAAKTGEPLNRWLERNPMALGKEVLKEHGSSLPFLFKVLSIQKSLSIQSHPDKALAEQLHSDRPHVYKDPNHKPEIALAVQDFEALCGFCKMSEISAQLASKPELRLCVGAAQCRDVHVSMVADKRKQRAALKAAFTALMTCEEPTYRAASQGLYQRLKGIQEIARTEKDNLFLRIYGQHPGDVGTLAVFFLNYVQLHPGEAVYLAANEPHAYLSGELVEAMANSDNVIRAGLTPKMRDTQVLCESLTYNQGLPHTLRGQKISDCIHKYQPPFHEFQVLKVSVEKPGVVSIPQQKSPMMLLCLSSEGNHKLLARGLPVEDPALEEMVSLRRGTVLFIPAHTAMELHSVAGHTNKGCAMLAYAATANDHMFPQDIASIPAEFQLHHQEVALDSSSNMPEVRAACALVADE